MIAWSVFFSYLFIAEVKSYYTSVSGYRDDKKRKVYLHAGEPAQA
jgi:hypothetical protein